MAVVLIGLLLIALAFGVGVSVHLLWIAAVVALVVIVAGAATRGSRW